MASRKSPNAQGKRNWKRPSPPDDSKFPELKEGYPDSLIKEKADSDSFHMDATQPITSMLATGDDYQYRGPRFVLLKNTRKQVYSDYSRSLFSILGVFNGQSYKGIKPPLYIWASEDHWKDLAMFPEPGGTFPGEKGNFYYLSDVGQRRPYPWQAHHLLPESAFTEENTKLTEDQMMVLERSFYNINNGHNIIMLPSQSQYSPVHRLITHFSSHPTYTFRVKERMEEISIELTNAFNEAKQKKDHLAPFALVLKRLHQFEDEFWEFVLFLSDQAATAGLAHTQDEAVKQNGGMFRYATTDKQGRVTHHLFAVLS